MTWQQKTRLAIGIFLVAFVAVVVVALRTPKPAVEEPVIPSRTDPDSIVETQGGLTIEHSKDGRTEYTIKAKGQRTYQDGRTAYQQATIDFPDRGGRAVSIRGNEAEVSASEGEAPVGALILTGDVAFTTSDGVSVKSDKATYNGADGMLTFPGRVDFTRGRMTGSGIGATYDQNREVLWLLDQARIVVAPEATGAGAMEATAGSAGLARPDHYARLIKGARVTTEGRVIEADDILIRMTEDDERVSGLELRANSRITGGAQAMSARDIDLTYGPDGRSLQAARLIENAVVQLPGEGRSPGRRIAGRTIDMTLGPDGSSVTGLTASDQVQVDLPADGATPARRIRSASLVARGADGAGLQAADFTGNVEYRESRTARGSVAAVTRTARAARLAVKTAPGLGALEEADFRGNVHVTDGAQVTADAARVLYRVAADRMDLSPGDGEPGKEPQVTDGRVSVIARAIELTPSTRRIKADTNVRSIIAPAPASGSASAKDGRMPSMLSADKPVNITANRLDYDGAGGLATYAGDARLWQDKGASIKGDTLILDDTRGNLTGEGNVATLTMVSDPDAATGTRKETLTTGKSERFVYDDAKRVATYTTKAQLHGAQGNLTGDKIELHMAAGASELERVEAYGAVTVKEGNRTATGTRLTYTAKDDRYVMTGDIGTPVVVIEQKDGDCTRTVGSYLEFRRAVEGISMKGMSSTPCKPRSAH